MRRLTLRPTAHLAPLAPHALLPALVSAIGLALGTPPAGAQVVDILETEGQAVHGILSAAAADGFGGAVVLEREGRVVLQAGYGLANRDTGVAFTARTIAQVGSITKQFTAMAILGLWEDGLLGLDDPVTRHLPGAADTLGSRTLHQLLTHTAGLPEYCGPDIRRVLAADLLACLSDDNVGPPGTVAYSNPGYSVLGLVVETVTGEELGRTLRSRYFQPLGMDRTGYQFPGVPDSAFAWGYDDGDPQPPVSTRLAALGPGGFWNLKGNGGIQASVEDMLRWARELRAGVAGEAGAGESAIITPAMASAAVGRHGTMEPGVYVGYGWYVRTENGEIFRVSHTGSDGVFFSAALWWPGTETFLYIVGNGGEDATLAVIREVLAVL